MKIRVPKAGLVQIQIGNAKPTFEFGHFMSQVSDALQSEGEWLELEKIDGVTLPEAAEPTPPGAVVSTEDAVVGAASAVFNQPILEPSSGVQGNPDDIHPDERFPDPEAGLREEKKTYRKWSVRGETEEGREFEQTVKAYSEKEFQARVKWMREKDKCKIFRVTPPPWRDGD